VRLKDHPSISKFKSPVELGKSYLELESFRGKSVVLPGKDAKPEEITEFYKKLGVPEKPEDYKLTELQGLHESIKISDEGKKAFFDLAKKANLTPSQVDTINQWYLTSMNAATLAQVEANKVALDKAQNELRKEWGTEYEKHLSLASRYVTRFGGPEAVAALGDLGSKPAVLKLFANAAKAMTEDSVEGLGFSSLDATAGSAAQKIKEALGDPKSPYMDANHPKHAEAVKEITELYKIAYPN